MSEAPRTVGELMELRRAAPEEEFLITDAERLTFGEADSRSAELAGALLTGGVGKGTRVGVLFPNCAAWLVSWLAAARIGALTVPLSTFAPGAELARLLRHTDTQVILAGTSIAGRSLTGRLDDGLPRLANGTTRIALPEAPYLREIYVWPDCERPWASPWPSPPGTAGDLVAAAERAVGPADDLAMVSTSGTTALPKSVVHTHASLVRHAYVLARHRGITRADRIYSPMPFFWVGGLTMVVLQALSTGATIITQDVFEPGATLRLLERERATIISCWAQASRAMADHPDFAKRDLSSVRAGTLLEALPPERRPAGPDLAPNLLGMTETGGPHTMAEIPDMPLPPEQRGSFGIPVPGARHRIADPVSGAALPPGEPGEIQVRGPILMDRIYKQERYQTFTADGWYATGDHGWFDAAGHLHFTGRGSSMIKVAGSNVAPAEVEAVLAELPGVLHNFVLGLPHPVRCQVVGAVIVPRHGMELTAAGITSYARARLSSYKVPAVIRFLAEDELPLLPTGKADREALTKLLTLKPVIQDGPGPPRLAGLETVLRLPDYHIGKCATAATPPTAGLTGSTAPVLPAI